MSRQLKCAILYFLACLLTRTTLLRDTADAHDRTRQSFCTAFRQQLCLATRGLTRAASTCTLLKTTYQHGLTRGDPKVTGIGLRRGERVGKLIVRPGVC